MDDERFDIDVGYRDPDDRRDEFPVDKPSPAEYEDRELEKAAPGSVHDHACCPPDDCCGGPCAAHPCWDPDDVTFEVREGDCVSLMAAMPACSVDSVVCDPPYGSWEKMTEQGEIVIWILLGVGLGVIAVAILDRVLAP